MASLKANGGVYRLLEKRITTAASAELIVRVALCNNGEILRDQGRGWRWHASLKSATPEQRVAVLEGLGYRIREDAGARALITKSTADAHAHRGAIQLRRIRNRI